MKKILLFLLILLPTLPTLAEEPFTTEKRQVPVNRGGEDDGTVCLLFYPDMPSVPYISVADFQALILPGTTIKVTKTGKGEYLLEGPYANATVNTVNDQFTSDDYMAFTNQMGQVQEGMDNVGFGGAPFLRYNHHELTPASATVTFDFSKYDIDLRGDEKAVYFPFATISDIFSDMDFHLAGYNGEKVIVLTGEDEDTSDVTKLEPERAKELLEAESREEDMAAFCYSELCFVIDHFYGMPGRSPLEGGIKNDGLDKTLDVIEHGPTIKKLLKSTNTDEYFFGMKSLQVLLHDGGHTNLMVDYNLFMAPAEEYEMEEYFEEWKERNKEFEDTYPYLYQQLMDLIEEFMESSKREEISMYRPSTSDQTYYKEGDTAFLMYDQFGPINNKAWKEYYENGCQGETPAIDEEFPGDLSVVLDALKQASEDPEVKNLVVDLACNTGGDFDVLMAMSVLMGGPNYYYSENLVTGQRQIAYFDVDTNFDGVFDEKDKEVKYDLNIAVLTSDVSFSCGNFFPSMMQDVGFPIIGERSGGGSCAVHPFITPEGMQFQISSARDRIANKNWENIDGGVEPDFVIDVSSGDYSKFYDVATIKSFINNYCSSPTAIVGIDAANQNSTCVYYDLSGRRLTAPAVKGVYILNGKKMVK